MKRKTTFAIGMLILLLSLTACSDVAREAYNRGWDDAISGNGFNPNTTETPKEDFNDVHDSDIDEIEKEQINDEIKDVTEKGKIDADNKAKEVSDSDSVLYSKNGTKILLKNDLPTRVNYAIGGIDSTTEILEISVGKETYTGLRLDVKCKKTYEREKSTPCAFNWKLYDSSDLLVDSGPIVNDTASIGEQFKESFTIYFTDLDSETYKLVFADFD